MIKPLWWHLLLYYAQTEPPCHSVDQGAWSMWCEYGCTLASVGWHWFWSSWLTSHSPISTFASLVKKWNANGIPYLEPPLRNVLKYVSGVQSRHMSYWFRSCVFAGFADHTKTSFLRAVGYPKLSNLLLSNCTLQLMAKFICFKHEQSH